MVKELICQWCGYPVGQQFEPKDPTYQQLKKIKEVQILIDGKPISPPLKLENMGGRTEPLRCPHCLAPIPITPIPRDEEDSP